MSIGTVIREILYLFRHSTGAIPTTEHLEMTVMGLQRGIDPLEIKDALITLHHEGFFGKYSSNNNLRSYDW